MKSKRTSRSIALLAAPLWGALVTLSCSDDPTPDDNLAGAGGSGVAGHAGHATGSAAGKGGAAGHGGGGNEGGGGQTQGGRPQGGAPAMGGAKADAGGAGGEADAGGAGGEPVAFDCSTVPTKPSNIEPVKGARGYHGVAFDQQGNLIGADSGTIYKTSFEGVSKVLAAGFTDVQGLDVFPNGDLVAVTADDMGGQSLTRITPEGAQQKLLDIPYSTYGVRIVPSGWVYYANEDGVGIFNPATKQKKSVTMPEIPRVLDFSPDHKKMYVGTLTTEFTPPFGSMNLEGTRPLETVGLIYVLELDASYLPVGKPTLFASHVGGGFHDGLGVDACGNLLVADFDTSGLYRVTSDGKVSLYHQWTPETYGHALDWGSGIGGWDKLTLYQPQPYNEDHVVKLVVGVPARPR